MAKKLLSLSLVVIMLFAFAVPAFASVESDIKEEVVDYVDKGNYAVTGADITAGDFTYELIDGVYYVTVDCGDYIFTCTAKYVSAIDEYSISDAKAEVVESSNWFMSIIIKIFSFFMNIFSGLSDILPF